MSVMSIAASGMTAATRRLEVAASNIANARTNGALPGPDTPPDAPQAYTPLRVDQVEISGGGTRAEVSPAATEPVPEYDPGAPYADENGMVAAPDVDVTRELVDVMMAKQAYGANAAVMRAGNQMYRALIDITR